MTGRQSFPFLMAAGLLVVLALVGCSTAALSGLDATNKFTCAAPDGVSCMSTAGVYANAQVGNLPGMKKDPTKPQFKNGSGPEAPGSSSGGIAPSASQPNVEYTTPGPLPTAQAAAPQNLLRASPAWMNAPTTGTPLRSPERILRVWIRPFEDADGDLHDQRYVYVTVNRGVWSIDAANDAIKSQYRTVRLMSKPDPSDRADSQGNGNAPSRMPPPPVSVPGLGSNSPSQQ